MARLLNMNNVQCAEGFLLVYLIRFQSLQLWVYETLRDAITL
jgi:hypothetical protein